MNAGWTSQKLMELTYELALRSPDPSTQNGAILVRAGMPLTATAACNEFPRGVQYLDERWERPIKYSFIEHAERNAIFNAARIGISTSGLTLACPWAACADCARAIIQADVIKLITHQPNEEDTNERWQASIEVAFTMLKEAGVEIEYFHGKVGGAAQPIRRDGKLWQP
jgi:dCMP deaminase